VSVALAYRRAAGASTAPAVAKPTCLGAYFFFFLCHFLMCAALLWNFFAVAVLHAPTESPCF
jgi:hypothetical protein